MSDKEKKKFDLSALKTKLFGTQGLIGAVVTFGLIFLVVIIVQSCTPKKGSMLFGLCDGLLAQQITFPQTIKYTSVEQYPAAVRLYFTYTDAYGQYQFEMCECTFKQDPQRGVMLERVFFNYTKEITKTVPVSQNIPFYEVEQKYIDLFNNSKSAQAIMAQKPDLTLPEGRWYRF